jgi:hypothetical protein
MPSLETGLSPGPLFAAPLPHLSRFYVRYAFPPRPTETLLPAIHAVKNFTLKILRPVLKTTPKALVDKSPAQVYQ